ncbi:MAG: hypothetical protein ACRDLP_18055, partial [Solirubrobacteraceae bacterium]
AGVTAGATVTINAAKHYQRIDGFGVSEGFGQAKALMSAPASVQKQVLSLLYSPTRGSRSSPGRRAAPPRSRPI